jgi:hypothetical protein
MKRWLLALVSTTVLTGIAVAAPGRAEAFTYACTPIASVGISGGGSLAQLTIYNPNAVTATVAAKWLRKNGTNLAGVAVPGAGGAVYPGQTGANTVTIAPGETLVVTHAYGDSNVTLGGDVAVTIRVVSSHPVNVGWGFGQTWAFMCTES